MIDKNLGADKGKLVKKGWSIGGKLFSVFLKRFEIDTSELPKLSDFKDIEDGIFIFDDLERCELSITQTLGMLNDLIENNGIKIIIVANQKEIGKISNFNNLPHKYMVALDERIKFDDEENKDAGLTKEKLIKRVQSLFAEDSLYV